MENMIGATFFTTLLEATIKDKLEQSNKFVKKHVYARFARVIMIPLSFTAVALNTLYGLGNGFAAICSGGKKQNFVVKARNYLNSSNYLLSQPFFNLLCAVNPTANISPNAISNNGIVNNGLLTNFVDKKIRGLAQTCHTSKNPFKHHVVSRLTYALLGVACLVTRVVDGVIGIGAGACALLAAGKSTTMNDIAWKALQTPGIIEDLWFSIMYVINPSVLDAQ
jgi:hypothetical protein